MTLDEVEKILGKPDFGTALPPLDWATATEATGSGCENVLAFIVRKNSGNMGDTEDVAFYLSFSQKGQLYWAAPQNLPTLKPLGSPSEKAPTIVQSQISWKEYVFADDGFAITLPGTPQPHADPSLPIPRKSANPPSGKPKPRAGIIWTLRDGLGKIIGHNPGIHAPASGCKRGYESQVTSSQNRRRALCVCNLRLFLLIACWFGYLNSQR
jgi:hypothetical protein